jgi:hypothetical protein
VGNDFEDQDGGIPLVRVIERNLTHVEAGPERISERRLSGFAPGTIEHERLAVRLAASAGLAAALASMAGFIPGVYRDPQIIIDQSHGFDVANLLVVLVLELGLLWASRGSVRGQLIAIGALGCLAYSFVTYAFFIVLNPATPLYIAVLGLAAWSCVAGFMHVDDAVVQSIVDGRLARRTTAVFLAILGVLFATTWLSQIAAALLSGSLPPDLAAAGWPMNPVWVLDLGFVLPLALLTALRLLRRRPGAERVALSFMVFDALLAVSILLMVVSSALAGQAIAVPMIAIFVVVLVVSTVLTWRALA